MSTDKTLSNVKPGGRVRLGDRVGALAMVRSNLRSIADLASKAEGDRVTIANINCEVTHALQLLDLAARQPVGSEGEDDAIEMLKALGYVWHQGGWQPRHPLARQPVGAAVRDCLTVDGGQEVGQEPVSRLIEAVEGECDGLAISRQAAAAILDHVFPLGQEPAAYMVDGRIEQGLFFDKKAAGNMATMNAGEVVPLFRWPAQAVDLSRARASIQSLLNWIDDWAETPEESGIDAIEAEAEAVLALIDSQGGE